MGWRPLWLHSRSRFLSSRLKRKGGERRVQKYLKAKGGNTAEKGFPGFFFTFACGRLSIWVVFIKVNQPIPQSIAGEKSQGEMGLLLQCSLKKRWAAPFRSVQDRVQPAATNNGASEREGRRLPPSVLPSFLPALFPAERARESSRSENKGGRSILPPSSSSSSTPEGEEAALTLSFASSLLSSKKVIYFQNS